MDVSKHQIDPLSAGFEQLDQHCEIDGIEAPSNAQVWAL